MQKAITFAGIDVAKAKLDIAIPGSKEKCQVDNSKAGWGELAGKLKEHGITKAAVEATGGYQRGVVAELRAHGVTVLVLQPKQVRDFARACLKRAKNDTIDAAIIAHCAETIGEIREPKDNILEKLADHLTFIEQIESDIVRFKTRLEHTADPRLKARIETLITEFKKQRRDELKLLEAELRKHKELANRLRLVLSIPGLGIRTALSALIQMPELGSMKRGEAAALAGLAPFDQDSGTHRGIRRIAGGRARVRRALYAAALPACFKWNKDLIDLYKTLKAKGKSHKQCLVAAARKLIIYANTVLARGTEWQDKQKPA